MYIILVCFYLYVKYMYILRISLQHLYRMCSVACGGPARRPLCFTPFARKTYVTRRISKHNYRCTWRMIFFSLYPRHSVRCARSVFAGAFRRGPSARNSAKSKKLRSRFSLSPWHHDQSLFLRAFEANANVADFQSDRPEVLRSPERNISFCSSTRNSDVNA